MKSIAISFILITTFCSISCVNNRPLIGVLSQDVYGKVGQAKIVASYVKYLESAGARVVPILINQNRDYYERIVNQTDGLLIPGGGQDLHSSGYAKAGQMIWNYTMSGSFNRTYPIWGTCLGFELMLILVDPALKLNNCSSVDIANKVKFTSYMKTSRLFKSALPTIIEILQTEDVTYNYHTKCLLSANRTANFDKFFNVLSTSEDKNGLEYISIIESKDEKHPVYGVQWHPEKNMFEFAVNTSIPHSTNAVRISQYMANFFVDQVRQSSGRPVLRLDVEHKLLIYNYQPIYTGAKQKYEYEQIYYFNASLSNL